MKLNIRITSLLVLVLLLLTIAIVPSWADPQLVQKINCSEPQTTAEMNTCAGQEYQAADKKLNQVYRQLQSKLNGQQRRRMTNAQLAWIKFRDANCAYEKGQFEGGTLASSTGGYCLARMTQQRTKELEDYLKDTNR